MVKRRGGSAAPFLPQIRAAGAGQIFGPGAAPPGDFAVVAGLQDGRNLLPLPGGRAGVLRMFEKTDLEKALAALRHQVETTSEYVGMNFVTEARRMHDGETAERAIYGEARPDEARKLLEDGVPVAPLPFRPARKTN